MTAQTANVDVVFVGGGIAAFWLACLAQRRGLSVAVIASEPLGGEQTMASQGIIHGGGKYLMRRNLTRRFASDSLAHLATMPARWRRCLTGNIVESSGDIDLRGLPVLAEQVELRATTRWSLPRLWVASQLVADTPRREGVSPSLRAARRVLLEARELCPRTRPKGAPPDMPQGLSDRTTRQKGRVELQGDFVIDVESLAQRLAAKVRARVVSCKVASEDVLVDDHGVAGIRVGDCTLLAQRYVFAAGAGNAELAPRAGFGAQATVLRPLHQVWARIEHAEPVFAHYLTRPLGVEPDLTVTTHQCDGATVLYLGGHLATAGVARSASAQKAAAGRAVAAALPHIDTTRTDFHTLRVDRAEPQRRRTRRASDAFLATRRNASLCFPVKLSLMPRLGDLFAQELAAIEPRPDPWRGDPDQPVATAQRPWA